MASASARRYARAIFELAEADGSISAWSRRLSSLRDVLAEPGLAELLNNPSLSIEQRQAVLQDIKVPQLGQEGMNLAKLLIAGHRVHAIDGIAEEFEELADTAAGRVRARVTAAVELSGSDISRIERDLSGKLGKDVQLQVEVDPAIIGGLVLQVGDRLIDASVATRLQQLRRRLAVT